MSTIKTPDGIGSEDGVIGVVGVAPWSSLQFCETLYRQISVTKDWHFPRVIVDIDTKIPSRGRHFDLGEMDFSSHIKQSIRRLEANGAAVVVVTCNTAHVYYERWGRSAGVPVPHIAQESVSAIREACGTRTAVLCGWSLRAAGLYEDLLRGVGIDIVDLSDDEARYIAEIIEEIKKSGGVSSLRASKLEALLDSLKKRGVDSLVLACTELSVLQNQAEQYFPIVVDSNVALARAALGVAFPRGY